MEIYLSAALSAEMGVYPINGNGKKYLYDGF
jgi:hypothetical protein